MDDAKQRAASSTVSLRLRIPRAADHLAPTRTFVTQAARALGRDDIADSATLLVDELMTHAVLNGAADTVEVTVESDGRKLRVALCDELWTTDSVPMIRTARQIVTALSDRRSTVTTPQGAIFWAEIG